VPTTFNPDQAKGKNAGSAITRRRFVKLDPNATDGETVVQCNVAGEMAYGVAMFSVSLAEITRGKVASVILDGRAIVEASAALAVGTPVSTTNDGRAKAAASGEYILGTIDEPASGAGNDCTVAMWQGGAKA